MLINIRLFGALRDKLPKEKRGKGQLDLPEGATIQDALHAVEIKRVVVVAINEDHIEDFDHPLSDGDNMTVFVEAAGG